MCSWWGVGCYPVCCGRPKAVAYVQQPQEVIEEEALAVVIVSVLAGIAVLSLVGVLHWYLWRRLVRDTTTRRSLWWWGGTVLLPLGAVLMVAAFTAQLAGASLGVVRAVAWPGFIWAALFLYLLIGVLVGEVVRPLLLRALSCGDAAMVTPPTAAGPTGADAGDEVAPPGEGNDSVGGDGATSDTDVSPTAGSDGSPTAAGSAVSRRLFVSRFAAGVTVAAATTTVGIGTYGLLNGPLVRRVTVPLAKLPAHAHGFRITMLSDLHLGGALGRGFTEMVVGAVNDTRPDMIAVLGDMGDGTVADMRPELAPLAGLRSRTGTYFVPGNHEYFNGIDQWLELVDELGMRVLLNNRTALPDFDLAGVADLAGEDEYRGPNFDAALRGRDSARPCVLLAHQPAQVHEAVEYGVDLQLSGHTHGGQVWPGNLIVRLANPTVAGLEHYGDTQLYVSRGVGAWGPPVRVAAPSDISVLELTSAQQI